MKSKITKIILLMTVFVMAWMITANASEEMIVFSSNYYSSVYGDLNQAMGTNEDALRAHFYNAGVAEGRTAQITFDASYYLNKYEDLKNAFNGDKKAALNHFRACGISEGRQGSKLFNVKEYLNTYPDLKSAFGTNYEAAYVHFLTCGVTEGRTGSSEFDVKEYLNKYEDLSNAFGNNYTAAFMHYVTNGEKEGRTAPVEKEQFTLTFETNGGSEVEAVTVEDGTTVDLTGYTSTKAGYVFAGWYKDADLTKEITSKKVTSNTTVYAKWIEEVTLSFNTNNGTEIASAKFAKGDHVDLSEFVTTKNGYDFNGWYSDEGLTKLVNSLTIEADTTVYAKWSVGKFTVTVLDVDDTTKVLATAEYDYNTTIAKAAFNAANLANYVVANLYADSAKATALTNVTVEGDVTIYAQVTPANFTLTTTENGGTAVTNPNDIPYGATVTIDSDSTSPTYGTISYYAYGAAVATTYAAPTKASNIFAGWYKDAEFKEEATTFTMEGNTEVFAKWTASSTLTINEVAGGAKTGTIVAPTNTTVDLTKFMKNDDIVADYAVTGFYSDIAGSKKITSYELKGNATIYASFEQKTVPVTVLNIDDTSEVIGTISAPYNTALDFGDYDDAGVLNEKYSVTNWYADESKNALAAVFKATTPTTIYAKVAAATYTFTATLNGGAFDNAVASPLTYGTEVTIDADASSANYGMVTIAGTKSKVSYADHKFCGWYLDSEFTTPATTFTVTANSRIYAKWLELFDITVKDTTDTLIGKIEVPNGTVVTLSEHVNDFIPTKGVTITKWGTNQACTIEAPSTMKITADKTVYAVTAPTTATLTFNTNGGSAIDTIEEMVPGTSTYTINAVTNVITTATPTATIDVPTKAGFAFGGWFVDSELKTPATTGAPVTIGGNTTLFAKWNQTDVLTVKNGTTGATIATKEIVKGTEVSIAALVAPNGIANGYTYNKVYADSAFENELTGTFVMNGSRTIYVKDPTATTTYTLTFNKGAVGTATVPDAVTQNAGTTLDITGEAYKATSAGYIFDGWFTAGGDPVSTFTFTASDTVVAHWKTDEASYTLNYVTNGGNAIDSVTDASATKITLPTPARTGFTFGGWYTDAALTTPVTLDAGKYVLTADATIYAKWTVTVSSTVKDTNDDAAVLGAAVANSHEDFQTTLTAGAGQTIPAANTIVVKSGETTLVAGVDYNYSVKADNTVVYFTINQAAITGNITFAPAGV